MKVAMYYNNDDIRIEEMQIPKISNDELLVKVIASGICGSDVMEWYRIKKAPIVLGHEISGIVEKAGKKVRKFRKGDRVFVTHHVPCKTCRFCINNQHTLCHILHSTRFYPGGFAQYLRVPKINVANGTFKLPDELNFDEGTFIEPLGCVVRGFRIAEFKSGKTFLVIGSGIAGVLNIKLAKALGSSKIFAIDTNENRLIFAKKIGANYVIKAEDDIITFIKKNNNGRLADFVVLCAGVEPAIRQAIDCVEPGGTILWFAPTKPNISVSLPFFDIWNKQIKMFSTYAAIEKDLIEAIELIRSREVIVTDMITHKLKINEIKKGFKLVSKAENSLKVIIEPNK
jgi:L-iditol 2-dehydrogenase